jgi:hypothetical protein
MKKYTLLLFLVLFAINSQAQSSSSSKIVTGIVITDNPNVAISGAKIKDMITGKETFTDSLGDFTIETSGNYIEISAEGFTTKYFTTYLNSGVFSLYGKGKYKHQKINKKFPITILGIVTDKYGPIPGVEVRSKKSKQTVVTDIDGKFCITVNKRDKVTFSFVGFIEENIKIETPFLRYYKIILIDASRIYI